MARIKLVLSYDGTDFYGFARQAGLRTVQGELERVLARLTGESIEVFGSGRTDKGVHARGQVVHWNQSRGPQPGRYPYVLRRVLPKDMVALACEAVEDSFHARFSVTAKTYRYTIQTALQEDIFTRRYTWHQPGAIDWNKVEECLPVLTGTHDFTSFCVASTPVEDKVRTVYNLSLARRDSYVDIYCTGSGFLQHMVRILVGTLMDVGLGRFAISDVKAMIQAKDRRTAGQTAPAQGLALWHVDYGESADEFRP